VLFSSLTHKYWLGETTTGAGITMSWRRFSTSSPFEREAMGGSGAERPRKVKMHDNKTMVFRFQQYWQSLHLVIFKLAILIRLMIHRGRASYELGMVVGRFQLASLT
jgi:hypothetical protein